RPRSSPASRARRRVRCRTRVAAAARRSAGPRRERDARRARPDRSRPRSGTREDTACRRTSPTETTTRWRPAPTARATSGAGGAGLDERQALRRDGVVDVVPAMHGVHERAHYRRSVALGTSVGWIAAERAAAL